MKTEKIRGLQSVQSLKGLKEGEIFLMITPQFDVANKVKLIRFDTTGMNRELAYFQYADEPKEPESFCIWEFDLTNKNNLLFPYVF